MIHTKCIRYLLFILLLFGCGSDPETMGLDASISTQAPPFINRIDPASGSVGATVTIFGFGFSNEAPNNIVIVGGTSATASSYSLLANPSSSEIESLTFTIPSGGSTGASDLFVTTFENVSNAVSFTINP